MKGSDPRCSPALRGAVFLAALLPFCAALGNDFLRNFDDGRIILEQPFLRDASLRGLLDCLSLVPYREEPLVIRDLSYWLNFALHGAWAPGFVLGTLLLHAATCLALLGLGERVFARGARLSPSGAQAAALAGALLFAVHPLHAESVVWISARKDCLSGLLYVLSASLWLDYLGAEGARARRRLYCGAGLLYLLALGSKSSVVSLPGVLFVADLWLGPPRPWRRRLLALAPFACVTLAYVKGYTWLLAAYDAAHEGESVLEAHPEPWLRNLLLTDAVVVDLYLTGFWFPVEQRVFTLLSYQQELSPRVLRGLFVCGAALAGGLWLAWRSRGAGFLAAWFALALVPFLNLVPTGILYADRYGYLSSVAGSLLFGLGAVKLCARWAPRARRRLALGALLVALAIPAALRCAGWARSFHDAGRLWERISEREPENWIALSGLAVHCAEVAPGAVSPRDGPRAEALYRRLIALRSDAPRYGLRYGRLLLALGREEEALASFRRAAALAPPRGDRASLLAYADLIAARWRRGASPDRAADPGWRQALAIYEHVIATWPGAAPRPALRRAELLRDAGQRSDALRAYQSFLGRYGFTPGLEAEVERARAALPDLEER